MWISDSLFIDSPDVNIVPNEIANMKKKFLKFYWLRLPFDVYKMFTTTKDNSYFRRLK